MNYLIPEIRKEETSIFKASRQKEPTKINVNNTEKKAKIKIQSRSQFSEKNI